MVHFIDPGIIEDEEISLILKDVEILKNSVPLYNFWIYSKAFEDDVGHVSLRTKTTSEEQFLWGNLGYSVRKKYRGHKFALKAARLIIKFAKICNMDELYFSADPANIASIKTIQNLGGYYLETILVPKDSSLYKFDKSKTTARFCLYI